MNKVLVAPDLKRRLYGLAQPLELCDESGRVLGRFFPTLDMSQWEPMTPDISEEELDRRSNSGERRFTTAELLRHLESQ